MTASFVGGFIGGSAMHKCRWCGCDIHPQMENECVSCWSIRMRVTAHPDIAERILADLRNGSPAKSCG